MDDGKSLKRLMSERAREINDQALRAAPSKRLSRRRFLTASSAVALGLAAGCRGEPQSLEQRAGISVDYPIIGDGTATTLSAQCPYCGVGCGSLILTSDDGIAGVMPDPVHKVNQGLQCIKGLTANEPIAADRLNKVLIRRDMSDPLSGHVSQSKGRFDDAIFREATWEEAIQLVADKTVALAERFGGNSIGLYGSGQLPIETLWLENVLMKGVLGSNTVESSTRLGVGAAISGYFRSFGSDAPGGCFDDITSADLICHWGLNARSSHPVLFWRIIDEKVRRDIPTLVVDPRRTATVRGFEDVNSDNSRHFATVGGDMAIQNAIAHVLLNDHPDAVAWDFLREHATGWQEYTEAVQARYSPEQVRSHTGVKPGDIRRVAAVWAEASIAGRARGRGGVLCFTGAGHIQHIHGESNTVSLINLLALSGNIGRPGAGPFAMTGQANGMGERLVGTLTGRLPFNRAIEDRTWRDQVAAAWRIPADRLAETASRANPGMVVGMMERALAGDLHALFMIGGTHVGLPDVNHLVRPALTRTFNVVHEIYRDAPNNLYADVILPAAPWGEWVGGTFVNAERRLYVTDGTGRPLPNTKADLDILVEQGRAIADRLGLDGTVIFPYERNEDGFIDPEDVLRDMLHASRGSDADLTGLLEVEERERLTPYEQLRDLRGIHWPAPTGEHASNGGIPRRFLNQEQDWAERPYGSFGHDDGKLHIHIYEQSDDGRDETAERPDTDFLGRSWDNVPADKYPFWLGLGVAYEHSGTAKTIRAPTTRRLISEQYVEMHPDDARALGVADGDWVRVSTRRGSYEARCSIGLDSVVRPARNTVPRGYLFSPYNLSVADSAEIERNKWLVNAVSHRAYDPASGQVDFKRLAARIERLA